MARSSCSASMKRAAELINRTKFLPRRMCHPLASTETDTNESFLSSLKSGSWVKFISGASNQDLPLIRNMCYLYTLAEVDCIDLSADPAVVMVATEGISTAMSHRSDSKFQRPLVMISVNDDDDPHFRKASFDVNKCPPTCPRPCEKVCPAWAIPPLSPLSGKQNTSPEAGYNSIAGVLAEKCYGCGRCVPICPLNLIDTTSYTVDRSLIRNLLSSGTVDAIEIHTLEHHENFFADLWNTIGDEVLLNSKVISISFPNMGEKTVPYLRELQSIISSRKSWDDFAGVQIWQSDGRPMSGDIGRGTVHKSSNLASYVLGVFKEESAVQTSWKTNEHDDQSELHSNEQSDQRRDIDIHGGKHFIQLAGGTNNYSAQTASKEGLLGSTGFGGFAFGGYARKAIGELLYDLEEKHPGSYVENHAEVLANCFEVAKMLVSSVKS